MKKSMTKIVKTVIGLSMAIGVGASVVRNTKVTKVEAASGEKTIAVSDVPNAYAGTSFTSDSISYSCSNINNTSSSGNIQWKSGSGYLYNTTAIDGITSILVNSGSTGSFSGTIYTGNSAITTDSGTSYAATGGTAVTITGSPSYFRIKAGSVSGGAKSGSVVISYNSGNGGEPEPTTYTGVEVSQKTALTGTYKGSSYYECQASVTGTGSYSSAVTWSITSSNTYGDGTSIANKASIDTNGKITFLDNCTVYAWATAADGSTHNTTGFAVTASELLDNPTSFWTKITDKDNISVKKVYALSNDQTYFAGKAVTSNTIALVTSPSSIGYVVLESAASGYYVRFATYNNDVWIASGNYIKWANDSTKLSSTSSSDSTYGTWNVVENGDNGVYLKNVSSSRHLGLNGTTDIRAYAASNISGNAPVYLWEVGSLPIINCDTIELTGKPSEAMSIGDTATLGYYALGTDGNEWNGDVVYSISNESTSGVIELSATSGVSVTLSAKKVGTARVSVQDKDKNADADYVDVTVLPDPERIELPNGSYTVVIDASAETSSTLPASRDYEIKAKNGRTWYQNLTVNFSGITVLANYHEYESAKTSGALTVINNSNAKISSVEVHYYKFENDGVGIYVNDSILTPTSSTGTSGTDNDLYRGYTNITGNTFALCNKNSDYTSKFYTVTITLTVADENEEFLNLVIDKGSTATSFVEGEAPNATGLTVYENYTTDGSTISRSEDVTSSVTWNYSVETIEKNTTSYTVTATYGGHTSASVTIDGFTVTPTFNCSLFESSIVEGDYVINYGTYALKAAITSNRAENETVTPSNNVIATADESIIWHIAPAGDYYTIYNASVNKYLAATDSKNQAQLLADGTDDKAKWSVTTNDGKFEFENVARAAASNDPNNKWLRNNGDNGWACYSTSTGKALSLYKASSKSVIENSLQTISALRFDYADSITDISSYSNTAIRFGGLIEQAKWSQLNAEVSIQGYGIMVAANSDLEGKTIKQRYYDAKTESNTPEQTILSLGYGITRNIQHKTNPTPANADQKLFMGVSGDYYIWTVKKSIDSFTAKINAVAFILVDGDIVFLNEVSLSAKEIATSVVPNTDASDPALPALTWIKDH